MSCDYSVEAIVNSWFWLDVVGCALPLLGSLHSLSINQLVYSPQLTIFNQHWLVNIPLTSTVSQLVHSLKQCQNPLALTMAQALCSP